MISNNTRYADTAARAVRPAPRGGASRSVWRLAIAIGLALFFLFPLGAIAKEAPWTRWDETALVDGGFKRYAMNEQLELYFNEERSIVAVRMLANGYVWYSSPLDWESDEIAQGYFKNAVPSLMQIRSRDKNGTIFPANSYTNVLMRKGLKVKGIANGFRVTNNFTRDGVIIPLDFTIEGGEFVVRLDIEKIELDSEWEIELIDITLLPFFGAAPLAEDGYLFVPDGSGALIGFNQRGARSSYERHIYGRDPIIRPLQSRTVAETVMLPVFGLSRENAGFLAIVEEGAGRSLINAEPAFVRTGYNNAYTGFIVRDYDVVSFREKTGTPRDVPIFESGPLKGDGLAVRYLFLGEEENNYVGMANAYRAWLMRNKSFAKSTLSQDPSLFVNFIGASRKVKPVMGIPQNVTIPYTPFKEANEILEGFAEQGVDSLVVKYDGWTKGGLQSDYPGRAVPDGALGGRRGLKKFLAWADEHEVPVFGSLDPVRLFKPGLTRMTEIVASKGMNKAPAKVVEYQLSTFTVKTDGRVHYILRKNKVASWFEGFLKGMKRWDNFGLAPDTLGNFVASDFSSDKGYHRTETARDFKALVEKASETRPLLFSRPLAHVLGSTSYVSDLPVRSSAWDIVTHDVPFYQILLKGYIPFSNLPANRELDRKRYQLSLVESGSNPAYLFIAQHHEDLRDSPLEGFMNTLAKDWTADALDMWASVEPVLEKVKGATIVAHNIRDDGLHTTRFSNNTIVYTNHATVAVQLDDGTTLEGLSFRLSEGVR